MGLVWWLHVSWSAVNLSCRLCPVHLYHGRSESLDLLQTGHYKGVEKPRRGWLSIFSFFCQRHQADSHLPSEQLLRGWKQALSFLYWEVPEWKETRGQGMRKVPVTSLYLHSISTDVFVLWVHICDLHKITAYSRCCLLKSVTSKYTRMRHAPRKLLNLCQISLLFFNQFCLSGHLW